MSESGKQGEQGNKSNKSQILTRQFFKELLTNLHPINKLLPVSSLETYWKNLVKVIKLYALFWLHIV